MPKKNLPMRLFLIVLIILVLPSSCKKHEPGTIPLIGINEKGDEVVEYANAQKYSHRLGLVINSLNQEIAPKLNDKAYSPWKMSTIIVGLQVNHRIGFGPVGVGIIPTVILVFLKG